MASSPGVVAADAAAAATRVPLLEAAAAHAKPRRTSGSLCGCCDAAVGLFIRPDAAGKRGAAADRHLADDLAATNCCVWLDRSHIVLARLDNSPLIMHSLRYARLLDLSHGEIEEAEYWGCAWRLF